jgi:hypothetical protein
MSSDAEVPAIDGPLLEPVSATSVAKARVERCSLSWAHEQAQAQAQASGALRVFGYHLKNGHLTQGMRLSLQ